MDDTIDLAACDREPIHIPGSIQPYGLLLVVNRPTDIVVGGAGPAGALIGQPIEFGKSTVKSILGESLVDLIVDPDLIGQEAVCIGVATSRANGRQHTALVHEVGSSVVLELLPDEDELHAGKILSSIRTSAERIRRARNPAEAFEVTVKRVRQLTGYDRVLIYQFLPDESGAVVAEDKDESLSSYLNHRFPASDIPRQARALYRINPIRVIPDVNYVPAALSWEQERERQLDMSQCLLRSVSPIHIRYLKNMGVGASMSLSLMTGDRLWGLIALHNQMPRRVSCETLELCRQIGELLSQYIHATAEADALRETSSLASARDSVMRILTSSANAKSALEEASQSLMATVNADGVAIRFPDGVVRFGDTPPEAITEALARWVLANKTDGICVTENAARDCPLDGNGALHVGGLLATVLPLEEPVVALWFRVEQIEEIEWAGNPHEAAAFSLRDGNLTPRRSFETWRETVRGRARPWSPDEVESAQNLRPRLAFVLQQEIVRDLNARLAASNERLARLATTDGLTGLANRRAFDDRLRSEWESARVPRRPFALVILDVDHFKQFNDLYGHRAGDECLKAVTRVIVEGRRVQDLAARIGGEEFALILPDTPTDGAKIVSERIRAGVQALAIPHRGAPEGIVTISVGASVAPGTRTGPCEDVIDAADRALYRAKEAGRNKIELES